MELRQLRYFVAIAETGGFTRAAERCGVTQPSLSQQIAELEKALKQQLFDRLGRKVLLTEAGRALLPRATAILAAVDETQRSMREGLDPGHGRLAVGAIPTIAPYVLPPVLRSFLRRYPDVQMHLREDLTQHVLEAVGGGDLDLALVAMPVTDDRFHAEPLRTEPLLVTLPQQHRLARRRKLSLADLHDEPFILLSEVHCLGEQIAQYCRQRSFTPRLVCRSAQLATVQQLIELGLGVSLLPALARDADRGKRRVYRELTDPQPTRTLAVVWHKHRYRSPTTRLFLDHLRAAVTGA
jgi:LysR family transcriptional regulator, hydrogen peroxide-inducible genes activator